MVREQASKVVSFDLAAMDRALERGREYKNGVTLTLVFFNGARVPGTVSASQID